MFATVHSVHASPGQLYLARAELERQGDTRGHNALVAFLDGLMPTPLVSNAAVTASVRGRSR